MTDPHTYIKKDVVLQWGAQIVKLNNEANAILDKIETETNNLKNYWHGNAANGFEKSMSDSISIGREYHNNMLDVDKMLKDVVAMAENE